MSIKSRLILHLLLASLILIGGGVWLGYQDVRHEARELFDAQLARYSRLILSMVLADTEHASFSSIQLYLDENQLKTPDLEYDESKENRKELSDGHVYETKLGFQVWDADGNLILKSPNTPITPISNQANGFSDTQFLSYDWRTFSITSKDKKYKCVTAERIDVRNDLIGKISSDLLTIFILLIPSLLLTMWFTIQNGLSPLSNLANQIRRRDADTLESIFDKNLPSEIKTITNALNQLLSLLKNTLEREKRITSDAAHELRTPLAAVKIHAELAESATNAKDRKKAISQILLGINRTTHLVDQLLSLARLEPDSLSESLTLMNFTQLIIEETALLTPLAHKKNLELSICESKELIIPIDDTSMRLLIRNLINNSIAYTQDGGEIEIYLYDNNGLPCLEIRDNGPGIPQQDYQRVLERFYRAKNHDIAGCGIGLSIVMRVVELHHATLKMSAPESGSGLIITICFPQKETLPH